MQHPWSDEGDDFLPNIEVYIKGYISYGGGISNNNYMKTMVILTLLCRYLCILWIKAYCRFLRETGIGKLSFKNGLHYKLQLAKFEINKYKSSIKPQQYQLFSNSKLD